MMFLADPQAAAQTATNMVTYAGQSIIDFLLPFLYLAIIIGVVYLIFYAIKMLIKRGFKNKQNNDSSPKLGKDIEKQRYYLEADEIQLLRKYKKLEADKKADVLDYITKM